MNKWTLLAPVTLVALLAGGYAMFARRPATPSVPGDLRAAESDLDVEDFEVEESNADGERADGSVGETNSYNMTDEGEGEAPKRSLTPHAPGHAPVKGVEVIEEEEDHGETVANPEVIDDGDEAGVEVIPSPTARPATPPPTSVPSP